MTKKKTPKKEKEREQDYCLTCRVPVSKCKGDCTRKQRKENGGKL